MVPKYSYKRCRPVLEKGSCKAQQGTSCGNLISGQSAYQAPAEGQALRKPNEERRLNPMLYAAKERGQGLVEYALILVLVAVVVIVILALLGPAIGNVFSNIVSSI